MQTKILNLVTSAKNQEKTQEKLQKLNVPQQQQQKNLQSHYVKELFLRDRSTCQNQLQFQHETFQTNVRTQNSKESYSQNTLKILHVGNLNKSISEEDLSELFGLGNPTYLKENCYAKIVFSKSDLSRNFTFITLLFLYLQN